MVGAAGSPPPHPATNPEIARMEKRIVNFFIGPFLIGYLESRSAIRVTSALGNDSVVTDDDRPTAAGEQETAEGFEIFLAVHKSAGAVISLGARECASVRGDEATLPLRSGYI